MLDIKFIRDNSEVVKKAVKDKGLEIDIDRLLSVDKERRALITQSESIKAEQKKTTDREKAKALKDEFKELERQLETAAKEYEELMLLVPNIPTDDTPIGKDETENKVLRQIGEIPKFDFQPKEHWELGQALDVIDSERAAKVSGARFTYRKGDIVLLELAIIQYTFSILTNEEILKSIARKAGIDISTKPFRPILPPVMIKPDVFQRMDRLEPKEERYYIPTDDIYLVGSAEHTMGAMHIDEIFDEKELPVRYIGFSTAFRREAGSYGKDMKGLIRMHHFDKLEIESFTLPEESIKEQNFIVAVTEYMVQELGLPYQVLIMCTGDMGKQDARHIDIETWLPGQNKYRETHTSDLMTDFQARRLNTRVKRASGELQFVHMNDATAFALSRAVVAIMENYQTADCHIRIPKVLQPYMGGKKEIK